MKKNRKKVIGAAAGAAAAAAVGVAAAKIRGGKPSVYHVRQGDDGWIVQQEEGGDDALATHRTKRKAVKAGRDLAGGHRPSQLVIHRSDDSVQKEHSYTEDD